AAREREAGLRDPVRLPMLRRGHDLDPVAGLLVPAEEGDRGPPEARLLRLVVEPGRHEQRVGHEVVGERRREGEHDEAPRPVPDGKRTSEATSIPAATPSAPPNQSCCRGICRRAMAYEPTMRQRKTKASGLKPTVRAAKMPASQNRRSCSNLSVASIAAKPSV